MLKIPLIYYTLHVRYWWTHHLAGYIIVDDPSPGHFGHTLQLLERSCSLYIWLHQGVGDQQQRRHIGSSRAVALELVLIQNPVQWLMYCITQGTYRCSV